MINNRWSEPEMLLAIHLYYRIPFGSQHSSNPKVIALAQAIRRTPSSIAMRLSNFTACDPVEQERGIKGLVGGGRHCQDFWGHFHEHETELSAKAEYLWQTIVENKVDLIEATENPNFEKTETFVIHKSRLQQRFFRRVVLETYSSMCCISGVNTPELLIASHILPWSSHPEYRTKPSNGLCFSAIHDKAFDCGLITLDQDLRLVVSKFISDSYQNDLIYSAFKKYEGQMISIPARNIPDYSALDFHRNNIYQGS